MWQSRGDVVRIIQILTRFNQKKNTRNAQNIHRKAAWSQYFENEFPGLFFPFWSSGAVGPKN